MATVLLTTDGSDLALAAMTKAVELLGREHRFFAISVVSPAFAPTAAIGPMESHGFVIDPALEESLEAEERDESTLDLAKLNEVLEIQAEALIETGDPGSAICEAAGRLGADLVVVGSHGHGWLQRVLIGSVSNHVLHHAPCAVMVMRLKETNHS